MDGATDEARDSYPVDRVTLVGLVFETGAGLRRHLAPMLSRRLGLSGQALEILVRLGRSPGQQLRMSDLAAQSLLTPSGLTRAVDRLVDAGLVRREICPSDRRGAFAALTPAGRETMEAALASHAAEIDHLLAGALLPDEELALVGALRKLRDRVHPEGAAGAPALSACLGTEEAALENVVLECAELAGAELEDAMLGRAVLEGAAPES